MSFNSNSKKSAHFANSISIYYYYVHFLLLGVRQEQDIYVRLIDSVTKQVSLLNPKIFQAKLNLIQHEINCGNPCEILDG